MEREYRVKVGLQEGIEMVLSAVHAGDTEEIELFDAFGRVLAEDAVAAEAIPPFDRSPLDGYAVRSADTRLSSRESPAVLRVIDFIAAGHTSFKEIKAGEAARIMTGAPIPKGADCIIRFEDTVFTDKEVRIFEPQNADGNYIHAGEDVRAGDTILRAGRVVTPADAGLMAGLGIARPVVYRRPKVLIISTGDELRGVSEAPEPGTIRNSSAYMLAGFLRDWGASVKIYGIVRDDIDEISSAVETCLSEADCVITTGGASVGDCDLTLKVLKKLEADILFWKIIMKPGMTTMAAVKDSKLILGLSGNPSAAAAALFLLGLPAIRKMSGRSDHTVKTIKTVLPDGFTRKSPSGRILPGFLDIRNGQPCLSVSEKQGNGMISQWSGCNLIGLIPAGTDRLERGSEIEALYLGYTR